MTHPTFTISIDRTGMAGSPAPLTFSGTPGVGKRGVEGFQEPRLQVRRRTVEADDIHGDLTQAWKYQQAILGFNVVLDDSDDEDEVTDLLDEIRAAITRFSYAVTVEKNGGTGEVWSCTVGEANHSGPRTYANLQDHNPVIEVSLPCHPVRS